MERPYRCWHRGLANASGVMRPLVYARYEAVRDDDGGTDGRKKCAEAAADDDAEKKRPRRVQPVPAAPG